MVQALGFRARENELEEVVMRFASAISTSHDATEAVDELLAETGARVTAGMVDLVVVFSTAHFEDELDEMIERVQSGFPGAVVMGCTAEGTIGAGRELESGPSMAMLVGVLPGVDIRPFHLDQPQLQKARTLYDWERIVGVSPENKPVFLAFADPFEVNIPGFLESINEIYPGAPVIGGVASAAHKPGENRLITNGEIHREGIAGVSLSGKLAVDTVVSQGCRPIGHPFVITKGDRNVVYELGGHPALRQLHNVLVDLPEAEEELARQALFLGRAITEQKDRFGRGDFLIQGIIGWDPVRGAIGIAGQVRVGATVQFHVRDPASADQDLRTMLAPFADQPVAGALLFGCNGRGTRMWEQPGHDIGVLREIIGEVPVAGFFCGGEFGPLGGSNFVHAFTASIALFRSPEDQSSHSV